MAKSANQKLKVLYLLRLLSETDKDHPVTMNEILEELERHGITAERKSIYDDMDALRAFGAKITARRGRYSGYYMEYSPLKGTEKEEQEDQPANVLLPEESCAAAESFSLPEKPDWHGGELDVTLVCDEAGAEAVQQAFGGAIVPEKAGKKKQKFTFCAEGSPEFFGWLTALGTHVRIASPEVLAKSYRKYLKEIRNLY